MSGGRAEEDKPWATDAHDVIVVGVGGMGSAACHHLALRGAPSSASAFDIPAHGSSTGSRIIRLAYYGPGLCAAAHSRLRLWRALGEEVDERILVTTGSLDAGYEEAASSSSLASCLTTSATSADGGRGQPALSGYRLPDGHQALFQPDGGFVLERAIVAHVTSPSATCDIRARER